MTTTQPRIETAPTVGGDRAFRPVLAWAAAGAGVLILFVYVFGSWILSGDPQKTPEGPTPSPGWMTAVGHAWEVAGLVALAGLFAVVVVHPWRRDGRPSADGLMILAFMTLIWADPLLNYHQVWQTFNASYINFGTWANHIPGWFAPNADQVAVPIVWLWPTYGYMYFAGVVGAGFLLRFLQARFPGLGRIGAAAACWLLVAAADVIAEPLMLVLGMYSYPGAVHGLTLFQGHYYQLPLYMPVLLGLFLTALALVRETRDDDGYTIAERGIRRVAVTPRKRSALRLLALVGVYNVLYLGTLEIPMQFFGLRAGTWPEEITKRSYLVNGVCGEGTAYACPGAEVPIPRPGSRHLEPDGTLSR